MIQQLKEAHSVVDRHIESSAQLSANKVICGNTDWQANLSPLPPGGNGGRIEAVKGVK